MISRRKKRNKESMNRETGRGEKELRCDAHRLNKHADSEK